jgi:hypothetical protein
MRRTGNSVRRRVSIRIGAARVTYIVQKPDQADNEQSEAVETEDKSIGGLGILHRVPRELLRLLESES